MDPLAIDFKDPEFIFRNLDDLHMFDVDLENDPEIMARAQTVQVICAQVCFYTLCALRAYQGVIKAPRILIYGAGVVGTQIINTLGEYGCSSMLRVYVRNNLSLGKWRDKGIKASDSVSKLLKAGTFEIVICTANAASFSQFTRDLFGKISPKTCVISAVFGLQRQRIYQLLKTPCVFRTYTERPDVLKMKYPDLVVEAPSSPLRHREDNGFLLTDDSLKKAAIFVAARTSDFKKHILVLENYFVMWGMTNEAARVEAINYIVGLGGTAQTTEPPIGDENASAEDAINEGKIEVDPSGDNATVSCESVDPSAAVSVMDLRTADEESFNLETQDNINAPALTSRKKGDRIAVLNITIDKLKAKVAVPFQQAFSRIAPIGELVEFSEFRWDVFSEKAVVPKPIGESAVGQTSFENRNRGIVHASTFLTDIEIKALFRDDNDIPADYFTQSEIIRVLDAEEALGMH